MTETLLPSPSSFSLLSADPNLSAMASNHDDPQTPSLYGDDFHSPLNNDLFPDDDRLNSPSDGGASTISSFGDAASSLDPNISHPSPKLLYLSFNQDASCFAAGTDRGFRVYNCSPFSLRFRREAENGGGIGIVQMLLQCNIFVMVGGGSEPQNPSNKVMVWDDHNGRFFGELSFRSEVKSVRFRRDRIVVVTNQKICVYNFLDFKLQKQIETIANPKGLCEVSHNAGSMVLVCPGLQKGQVRIEHYSPDRTKIVVAHDSKIACLALANDGRYLATASSKGTLVRIFNTEDGSLLQEVRRGASTAEIYSLALSPSAQWLAVSSDTGTVHVFSLKVDSGPRSIERTSSTSEPDLSGPSSSSRSFIKGVLPKYFSSEWSVARFHLKERSQFLVAFGQEQDTILIIGMDGSLYRCKFDAVSGGEMTQLEYHNFLKPE